MKQLSVCGMECEKCPLFMATVKQDKEALTQLALDCSIEGKQFQPEDMHCLGCWTKENDCTKMCMDCEIRNCGKKHGKLNCGECEFYPCEIYERRIPKNAQSRKILDEIHNLKFNNI